MNENLIEDLELDISNTIYSREEVLSESKKYFKGDSLCG